MARLELNNSAEGAATLTFSPLLLPGGSELTLVSPTHWRPAVLRLSNSIENLHAQYTQLFGTIPAIKTSIRLMDEESFFRSTGAPRWTNALYYREEIKIPLSSKHSIDWANLLRAVRHEYTHAVIHALTDGKCPGWLDEGLAQWAEGAENPALRPALLERIKAHGPVPLSLLQGGFTRLDADLVPAAYAQSLYLSQSIIRSYRFSGIRRYFYYLRNGADQENAFQRSFQISRAGFERAVGSSLTRWVASKKEG